MPFKGCGDYFALQWSVETRQYVSLHRLAPLSSPKTRLPESDSKCIVNVMDLLGSPNARHIGQFCVLTAKTAKS